MTSIEIIEADLDRPDHQQAVVRMLDAYAQDPMGDGKPLPQAVKDRLIPGLRRHPTTLIFLAVEGETPVGIVTAFYGFSTFAARPLINIHDLAVLPGRRGEGIGKRLVAAVEQKARCTGCCKLTLEVQENNHRARHVYGCMGFARSVYQEAAGGALFLAKAL